MKGHNRCAWLKVGETEACGKAAAKSIVRFSWLGMIVVVTIARGQLFIASAHWTATSARSSVVFFSVLLREKL